jgi:uncharacterized protein YbjT (DUF2867 family)
MKNVVIGASGLIGSKLVKLLRQRGQDVVEAALESGVNTITGEGLDEVLEGAEAVVDVTNSPSLEGQAAQQFFEMSGRNIIAAEVKAGVRYHVILSIVGTEHLQGSSYFRGKMAQEKLIQASLIPYTIVRSTQFFEFLRGIANSATDEQTVRLSPALFQPIAADDAVTALADVTMGPPVIGIVEVAGPERVSMADLVKRYLLETHDLRKVVADPSAHYFGTVLNDGSLTPGDGSNARIGSKSFEQWLNDSTQKAPQTV